MVYSYHEKNRNSLLVQRNRKIAKTSPHKDCTRLITVQPIDDLIAQCIKIHNRLLRSNRQLNAFNREIHRMTAFLDRNDDGDNWDELTTCSGDTNDGLLPDHNEMFEEFSIDWDCSNLERSKDDFKKEVLKWSKVELNKMKNTGNTLFEKSINNNGSLPKTQNEEK